MGLFGGLEHVSFGAVLGKEGKPLKMREGGVPELNDLLDDAVAAAARSTKRRGSETVVSDEKVAETSPETLRTIYEVVGLGAVKYADLSQNRTSDYKYDPDKMMAMDGNTGTYMQYAYVRNRGIFRKGGVDPESLRDRRRPCFWGRRKSGAWRATVRFEESADGRGRGVQAEPRYGVPLGPGQDVQRLLPELPRAEGRDAGAAPEPAAAVRPDGAVIQRGLDLLGIRTVERM